MKKIFQKGIALPVEKEKELVVLVADNTMKESINSLLLNRQTSLGISIARDKFDIFTHPGHDPGCCKNGVDFLMPLSSRYKYALMLFDYEGSGSEDKSVEEIEEKIKVKLRQNGWADRSEVIAIYPELENWVWSNSPCLSGIIGWRNQPVGLQQWLLNEGFIKNLQQIKPQRPKEALEAVLQKIKKPRSSSIYKEIAEKVSVNGCQDRAFNKFVETLRLWFER